MGHWAGSRKGWFVFTQNMESKFLLDIVGDNISLYL